MRFRSITILSLIVIALIAAPQFSAMPNGKDIPEGANEAGCYCHLDGGSSDTEIQLVGLPTNFTSGTTYNLTLTITNDDMDYWSTGPVVTDPTRENGGDVAWSGFRIIHDGGILSGNESLTQVGVGGALTHTEDGNKYRTWNLQWTAPTDETSIATFFIWGNAVNGDSSEDGAGGASSADKWNSAEFVVLGAQASADDVTSSVSSARALYVLMTAVLLAVTLMLLATMYIFYSRNPEGFSISRFWDYLKGWLSTTDHKGVGLLYLNFGLFFFLVGGILALLFRIQLAVPENDFLTMDEYNSFFTLHGTTMVFLAAMPMIAGFGNYIVPLQIGAQDLAFPRVNALGFWMLAFSCILIFSGVFVGQGSDITWVMYPPYSSVNTDAASSANHGTTLFLAGMLMLGASSTLGGVNFIATIFAMRAPGVTWMKMPLFTWSFLISMFMLFLSLPALIIGVLFLFLDHTISTSFYATGVGDPVLFQHLFWFFGHPEVYVVIVPAFGVVSEVLATSARRSIFGYKSMVYAMAGIGIVGFIVWGHHMLTSGMHPVLRFLMMGATMLVAIPTGVKIFNWLATLWGGSLVFKTHTLWALGFLVTFTLGGISGMFFPVAGLDTHFHDTYFVVAHFHYVFIGGTVFGLFSAFYYWYPKWTGRKMNEKLGMLHFLCSFTSYNAAFWPMHKVGIMGMPRRTWTYAEESGFGDLNYSITIWAIVFGLSQLIFVWNMVYSQKRGEIAGSDPWGGWSLEWTTTSPPPTPSFSEIPTQGDDNEEHDSGAGMLTNLTNKLWSTDSGKEVES